MNDEGSVVERNPAGAVARLLGYRPPLAPQVLGCGSQLSRRWTREGFDGYAPAMPGHLVATYYEREQPCTWTRDGRTHSARLRRGTITLVPEGSDGRWSLAGRIAVSHLYLTGQRLTQAAEALGVESSIELFDRLGVPDAPTAQLLEVIASNEILSEPAASLFLDRALDLVCLQLIGGHSSLGDVRVAASSGLADWQTKRVIRYMRERLDQPIQLDELASLVGLSRFHFCTAFRRATGLAPHTYLRRARILRACELLQDTGQTIGEVAGAVGYTSLSAFSTAFRRIIGATPSEYRRKL